VYDSKHEKKGIESLKKGARNYITSYIKKYSNKLNKKKRVTSANSSPAERFSVCKNNKIQINSPDTSPFFVEEDKFNLALKEPEPSPLNDYPSTCKFSNPDPTVIMASTLRDLVFILNKYKSKDIGMFRAAKKSKSFIVIEKEIASLRTEDFFGESRTLASEEKLLFFINLRNFLVLYGLCKSNLKVIPNTQFKWIEFLCSISVNLAGLIYTAFEIEHAILRATMPTPKVHSPYIKDNISYPKYAHIDRKHAFAYDKKEPLINFALYLPTVSSPPLMVYTPDEIFMQMKKNAGRYLENQVKAISSATISLPQIFEWYREDFDRGNDKNDLIYFIANCLSQDESSKLFRLLTSSVRKDIIYEKYNWNFAYEYNGT